MYVFLLILHLFICLGLIGVVLVQSGKGGGLAGGAFGGSAQTVFGGRGATDFITRATMVLGVAFFVTSLVLALMSSGVARTPSLIQREAQRSGSAAPPVVPGARPTPGAPSPPPASTPSGGTPAGTTNPVPPSGTPPPGGGPP
jgi:preprotein translocase subunit SecG